MLLDRCLLHAVQLKVFQRSMATRNITPKQGINDLVALTESYNSRHVKAQYGPHQSTGTKNSDEYVVSLLFVVVSGVVLGRTGGTEESTVRSTYQNPWWSA